MRLHVEWNRKILHIDKLGNAQCGKDLVVLELQEENLLMVMEQDLLLDVEFVIYVVDCFVLIAVVIV